MHTSIADSPAQVRAEALENTTSYLGLSVILFLASVVLVLPRLKGALAPLVTNTKGGRRTYINSYLSALGGFFFVDLRISADSF